MAGDRTDPYATIGPAVEGPTRSRRRWWLVAVVVAATLVVAAAVAYSLRADYNDKALLFCISQEEAAAIHDETLRLVPAQAQAVTSGVSDCDDRRATTVQFTAASSTEESLSEAGELNGWARATPACSEKRISGTDVHLEIGVVAAPDPNAGQWSLYASPGSC